jgi:hypothetical protein
MTKISYQLDKAKVRRMGIVSNLQHRVRLSETIKIKT